MRRRCAAGAPFVQVPEEVSRCRQKRRSLGLLKAPTSSPGSFALLHSELGSDEGDDGLADNAALEDSPEGCLHILHREFMRHVGADLASIYPV